jgi:hypothetical protein
MAIEPIRNDAPGAPWARVERLVRMEGSFAHPHRTYLAGTLPSQRDLADAVHALCMLHGDHPGMVDAAAACAAPELAEWLTDAAGGVAVERAFLARIVAAAGPVPSTPGQADTEAVFAGQRHAFEMLGKSGRHGCALGAVIAYLLDWQAMRSVLDVAADRFGVAPAPLAIPTPLATTAIADRAITTPAAERALAFGAQQLIVQHRGLWDLLEARASAREQD